MPPAPSQAAVSAAVSTPPTPSRQPAARAQPSPSPEPVFEADSDDTFDDSPLAEPAPRAGRREAPAAAAAPARPATASSGTIAGLKDAFIEEVRRTKVGFYRMTVAQAHRIEVEGDRIVFSFTPAHRLLKDQLEQNRTWLEPLAARVAGRRMLVVGTMAEPASAPAAPAGPPDDLKAEAAADPGMQTLLELMPLEIKDVERL